ncbi:hypothetical protein [Methylomonas koyamae]|uniref:hypothetical protein n=1 Tax=Methylomonas koyamae TaxID=702114 RepID=UPI00278C219A|nr:hypothetical protein [Methylomonas koyamae]
MPRRLPAGEHATLHRREMFADRLLQQSDHFAELRQILFRQGRQTAHQQQITQAFGLRLRKRRQFAERTDFLFAM